MQAHRNMLAEYERTVAKAGDAHKAWLMGHMQIHLEYAAAAAAAAYELKRAQLMRLEVLMVPVPSYHNSF